MLLPLCGCGLALRRASGEIRDNTSHEPVPVYNRLAKAEIMLWQTLSISVYIASSLVAIANPVSPLRLYSSQLALFLTMI